MSKGYIGFLKENEDALFMNMEHPSLYYDIAAHAQKAMLKEIEKLMGESMGYEHGVERLDEHVFRDKLKQKFGGKGA